MKTLWVWIIGCKEPQSIQNSITCYTGLLENKIKMYQNLLHLGPSIVQDPALWLTIWQNSPKNHLFFFRWKHTWQVHLLHVSRKLQQITCISFLIVLLSHKEEGQEESCWDKFCPASAESPRDWERHSTSSWSSFWGWSVKLHRHRENEKCITLGLGFLLVFCLFFLRASIAMEAESKIEFQKGFTTQHK